MAEAEIEVHCRYLVPTEKFGNKDMGAVVKVKIDTDDPKKIVKAYKEVYEQINEEVKKQRMEVKKNLSLKDRKSLAK